MATPTASTKWKLGKGIQINSQAKTVISNVYEYFAKCHVKGRAKPAVERTAEATGMHDSS